MRYLIAHAPHAPGRKESLARLLEPFKREIYAAPEVLASRGPEHASIWARRLWERAAEINDHVCLLNDDVSLAPDFEERIARAVQAVPDEPISLHCTNPAVMAHPDAAWVRCYHYTGPAVILPPGAAASLLEFVYALPWSFLSRLNEDNIAMEWAWSRQRPFWYLLPSPVWHDTGVPSTLGYDHHPHRVPVVVGPERDVTVKDPGSVPFVELDWCRTEGLDYRRNVLKAGRSLCFLCTGREGVVGDVKQGITLCTICLGNLTSTALRAI
jgi:hypothetical protein